MFSNFPLLSPDLLSQSEQSLYSSGTACNFQTWSFCLSLSVMIYFLSCKVTFIPTIYSVPTSVVATSSFESAQHLKAVRSKLLRQPQDLIVWYPLCPLLSWLHFHGHIFVLSPETRYSLLISSLSSFFHTQLCVFRKAISATWHLESPPDFPSWPRVTQ